MVCELPGDVVLSILDHLSRYAKPWYRELSQVGRMDQACQLTS
jgi:hypothetical protein